MCALASPKLSCSRIVVIDVFIPASDIAELSAAARCYRPLTSDDRSRSRFNDELKVRLLLIKTLLQYACGEAVNHITC